MLKKTKTKFLVLAFIFLTALQWQIHPSQAYSFQTPRQLTSNGGTAIDTVPSSLQASNGTLWLTWERIPRIGQANIYAMTYNAGVWSSMFNITTSHPTVANVDPSLKQLQNGTMILVWGTNATGLYQLYYETLQGNRWTSPLRLTTGSFNDYRSDMSVAPDGTLWIVWYRQTTSSSCISGFCRQLYYKTLKGNTWSADAQLTTDNTWNVQPDVTITKDSTVVVAFSKWSSQGSDYDIYYKKYTGTWTADTLLATSSNWDTTPNLEQDRNGTVWLFWARELKLASNTFEDQLFYKFSPNEGGTWSADTELTFGGNSTNTIDSSEPDATQAIDKSLWVFYSSDATGQGAEYDIYCIKTNPITPIHDVDAGRVQYPKYQYRGGLASIGESPIVKFNVTVVNSGDYTETPSVSLTVSNSTTFNLGTQAVTIPSGASAVVTFNWNTTGVPYGSYTLAASVTPVPGENSLNTPDNYISLFRATHIGPWGDIDQDGKITVIDAGVVFLGFGSKPGLPHWNPLADINNNGVIDIIDAGIVSGEFGLVT